jgi:hypothetical protein
LLFDLARWRGQDGVVFGKLTLRYFIQCGIVIIVPTFLCPWPLSSCRPALVLVRCMILLRNGNGRGGWPMIVASKNVASDCYVVVPLLFVLAHCACVARSGRMISVGRAVCTHFAHARVLLVGAAPPGVAVAGRFVFLVGYHFC